MNNKDKENKYLFDKNLCKLKVDGITVNIEYTKNNKNFNDCIINILKIKKGCI